MADDPRWPLHVVLPAIPGSVSVARELIRNLYADRDVDPDPDTVLLLVSELVSNAILYAGQHVEMTVWLVQSTLRIAVSDASPALPQIRGYSLDATSGRGLQLVAKLAERWGVTQDHQGYGKSVWFEFGPPVAIPETSTTQDHRDHPESPRSS